MKYLKGVSTLRLNADLCTGCGMCKIVCPHRVFALNGKLAEIGDLDACMECGACAKNCPAEAIKLTPGVGCATYILQTWIRKDKAKCGCGIDECC